MVAAQNYVPAEIDLLLENDGAHDGGYDHAERVECRDEHRAPLPRHDALYVVRHAGAHYAAVHDREEASVEADDPSMGVGALGDDGDGGAHDRAHAADEHREGQLRRVVPERAGLEDEEAQPCHAGGDDHDGPL